MRLEKTILAIVITGFALAAIPASAHHNSARWDKFEDRIDRLENRRDERVNHGPRDRLEDRVDRWEDRRDRKNLATPRFLNRWEHRSWKRRWGSHS